jgi:hypothetical protein
MSENSNFDAAAASEFLQSFFRSTRENGDAYFRKGAVKSLRELEPGRQWIASVQGKELYNVALGYDPELREWDAECDCPVGTLCKHAYAAMLEIVVRKESDNEPAPSAPDDSANNAPADGQPSLFGRFLKLVSPKSHTPAPPPEPSGSLRPALEKALGRKVAGEEKRFVDAVIAQFRQSGRTGLVYPYQLHALAWKPRTSSYESIRIAPGRSRNELEFWFALAAYAAEQGFAIPAFMQALPIPPEVASRIAKNRRREEIARWKQTLAHLPDAPAVRGEAGRLELRVRLDADQAVPETRVDGKPWRGHKSLYTARIDGDDIRAFDPETRMLWTSLARSEADYSGDGFHYTNGEVTGLLASMLALPAFRRLFVAADGSPLVFHEEALRWEVIPPEDDEGDYLMSLRRADGSPAPKPLFVVPGEPALHVTAEGVFPGPPSVRLAEGGTETRVPAVAFESAGGLKLLKWLRVAPPAKLAAKIRTVRLRAAIRAEIVADPYGRGSEQCRIQVAAAGPKGDQAMVLGSFGWMPEDQGWTKKADGDDLVDVDRSALDPVARAVTDAGFKPVDQGGNHQLRVTKKFPGQFLDFLKSLPAETQVELRGELASLQGAEVSGQIRLAATEAGIDWFDLQVVVDVNDTTLTPEEIKLLLDAKGGWVRLTAKGWRRLEYKLSTEEDQNLAKLGLTPHELTSDPQRLHALQLAEPAARKFLPAETCERIERRASELKARVAPAQPEAIGATLRPYQTEGFHFLAYLAANRFGGILADDMGLGKTLQTLTWIAWLRNEGADAEARSRPSLVVCPKSVQDNWRAEAERFCPGLKVRVWSGNSVKDLPALIDSAALHVVNYAQLRSVGEALARIDLLAAILDEGQNIKNPSSQTALIARQLRATHRLILSGTPIENRLLDLWSLMAYAMPGALGSRAEFGRLFDPKDDPFARQRLAARVRPFLLRRTKTQVARDLPDRVEEDLYCEIEGEQKTLYKAELKRAQQMLLKLQTQSALNKERFNVLTSLLRLRQICCHPKLVKADAKSDGAKLEALLETLEPLIEEGEKVLVFSQFVDALHLLKEAVEGRDWKTWYLAGDTENRGELVKEFQGHEGAGVFLISLKAGGAGLNLTAASYVVLFDPWWNPAVENQAIDRTHRIGQARKVIAYRLLIKDSIEEKIRSLQKQKGALANDVLGEEKFAQSLTLDDLRFLLAG